MIDGSQIPPAAVWSYDECITAAAEKGYEIGFSVKNGIFGIDFDNMLERGNLKPEYAHFSEIVVRNVRHIPSGRMLWTGITTGYKSQSEADATLMVMLADACNYNIWQMERLFLQSGLAKRDKAQNRPDYIRRTAIHAIQYVYEEEQAVDARIAALPKWLRKHVHPTAVYAAPAGKFWRRVK